MRETMFAYHARYGYNPHSLVSIAGASGWEASRAHGAVPYRAIGRTWLACEPLARSADLETVAREFLEFARAQRKLVAFLPATQRFAELWSPLGLDCIPIGMSPYFDLSAWNPTGSRGHTIRKEVRKARTAGVTIETLPGGEYPEAEVAQLEQAWASTRRTVQFGWLFGSDIHNFPECRTNFLARDSTGRLVALLSAAPLPARKGSYLKDFHRHPEAPKGTTDLLFVTAFEYLLAWGIRLVTPGTVPLHGITQPDAIRNGGHRTLVSALDLFARRGEAVYNFAGLYRFKARLDPQWWEHEYALAPPTLFSVFRIGWAAARATAPDGVFKAVFNGSWRSLSGR